jgi:N-carbamoylputrescine amidase
VAKKHNSKRRSPVTAAKQLSKARASRPGIQNAAKVRVAEGTTRVALIQMQCGPDPAANSRKAIDRVREAARDGGQIICLPELFRSQYFCQAEDHKYFELAETIPGPSTESLGKVARESGAIIVASLFERRTAGLYHNTAVVIGAK